MLTKPENGRTKIFVGKKMIGEASDLSDIPYVTDVSEIADIPFNVLNTFLNYFQNQAPFVLEFDAEGWHFGLVKIFDDLYVIDDKSDATKLDARCVTGEWFGETETMSANDMIIRLAEEVIDDIRENLNDWEEWSAEWSDYVRRSIDLARKCELLDEILERIRIEKEQREHPKHEYRIYQVNPDTAPELCFMPYRYLKSSGIKPTRENYDMVFSGLIGINKFSHVNALDYLYEKFNIDHPQDYKGRNISVSDVIEIDGTFWYVDSSGYVEINEDF